jgi:hypothetical protein
MGQAAPASVFATEVGLRALGSFGLRMLCAFALMADAWMGESFPGVLMDGNFMFNSRGSKAACAAVQPAACPPLAV